MRLENVVKDVLILAHLTLYFPQNVSGVAVQEDFSELPPNQRRKKLQAKLDELTAKISQV